MRVRSQTFQECQAAKDENQSINAIFIQTESELAMSETTCTSLVVPGPPWEWIRSSKKRSESEYQNFLADVDAGYDVSEMLHRRVDERTL